MHIKGTLINWNVGVRFLGVQLLSSKLSSLSSLENAILKNVTHCSVTAVHRFKRCLSRSNDRRRSIFVQGVSFNLLNPSSCGTVCLSSLMYPHDTCCRSSVPRTYHFMKGIVDMYPSLEYAWFKMMFVEILHTLFSILIYYLSMDLQPLWVLTAISVS
jgi:hypothetical protein